MVSVARGRFTPGGGGPGGQGFSAGGGTIDPRDRALHTALAGVGLSGPVIVIAAGAQFGMGVGLAALPGIDAGILWYLRKKKAGHLVQAGIAAGSGPAFVYNMWRYGPGVISWLLDQKKKSRGGSTMSSQRYGTFTPSTRGGPSAQKTRRAQGIKSRGRTKFGRERPWCRVHQRHHWCQFTR